VQFGFQFEIIEGAAAADTGAQPSETAKAEALPAPPDGAAEAAPTPPDANGSSGGEVVRLDRFRKK